MRIITCLLLLLLSINTTAQIKDDYYESFSSIAFPHTIRFINDSVVMFQNIKRHMQSVTHVYGKFKKNNDTLYIDIPRIQFSDSLKAVESGIYNLSGKKLKLTQHKTEFIDRVNQIVYVKSSIFRKKRIRRKRIILLNGRKHILDCGLTNGYGLIESEPLKNRTLTKFYSIVNHLDDYTTTQYNTLEAYEKFGILGIHGISSFDLKNKS